MDEIQKNNRKKLIKIILVHLEITPTQIAEELNVSVSVISKHISGDKIYYRCDLYLIEQIFAKFNRKAMVDETVIKQTSKLLMAL